MPSVIKKCTPLESQLLARLCSWVLWKRMLACRIPILLTKLNSQTQWGSASDSYRLKTACSGGMRSCTPQHLPKAHFIEKKMQDQVYVIHSGFQSALPSGGWHHRMLDQPSAHLGSKAFSTSDRIKDCPSEGVRHLNNTVPWVGRTHGPQTRAWESALLLLWIFPLAHKGCSISYSLKLCTGKLQVPKRYVYSCYWAWWGFQGTSYRLPQ